MYTGFSKSRALPPTFRVTTITGFGMNRTEVSTNEAMALWTICSGELLVVYLGIDFLDMMSVTISCPGGAVSPARGI